MGSVQEERSATNISVPNGTYQPGKDGTRISIFLLALYGVRKGGYAFRAGLLKVLHAILLGSLII
jgi:hypothetical protein